MANRDNTPSGRAGFEHTILMPQWCDHLNQPCNRRRLPTVTCNNAVPTLKKTQNVCKHRSTTRLTSLTKTDVSAENHEKPANYQQAIDEMSSYLTFSGLYPPTNSTYSQITMFRRPTLLPSSGSQVGLTCRPSQSLSDRTELSYSMLKFVAFIITTV